MTLVDTYDDLDIKLATEDHRQGKPFGERGHCTHCDKAADTRDREIRVANCLHEHVDDFELKTLDGVVNKTSYCADCGASADESKGR